jgi:hypothetical protein
MEKVLKNTKELITCTRLVGGEDLTELLNEDKKGYSKKSWNGNEIAIRRKAREMSHKHKGTWYVWEPRIIL